MLFRTLICACLVAVTACGVASCRKNDMRTAAIYVPALGGRECADVIAQAVSKDQNISPDAFEFDAASRMLYIRYDSLTMSLKNLEFSVAKAGFQANDIPPDPKAREQLPETCR